MTTETRPNAVVALTDAGLAAGENDFLADLGPDERGLLRQVAANLLRRLRPPSR